MLANHDSYATRLPSADLVYGLPDVDGFLSTTVDDRDEWCVETVTRKRKERQDSGSSSVQERKVIRSNSEERTTECQRSYDEAIRRVSSHEDFERNKKPTSRAPTAAPLHEQNYERSSPLEPPAVVATDYDASFYVKDANVLSDGGEKFAHIFGPTESGRSSVDFLCFHHRKHGKSGGTSPSRSRIHEHILFPKRVSPNRDPNVDGVLNGGGRVGYYSGDLSGDERDHERARCNERRSRTPAPRPRRGPLRRQPKQRSSDHDAFKENDGPEKGDPVVHQIDKHRSETSASPDPTKLENFVRDAIFDAQKRIASVNIDKSECRNSNVAFSSSTTGSAIYKQQDQVLSVRDRSQSPVAQSVSPVKKTPVIDLTTLHEQLGQNEPVPSVPTKLIGFPWDTEMCRTFPDTLDSEPVRDENVSSYDNRDIFNIRIQRRTLPDKCDVKSVEIAGSVVEPDERLNKIIKKIQVLKKKIAKCETEFEESHGYRASHADKMNDEVLRKLYSDLRRLKNEKKAIRAGPGESLKGPVPAENTSGESLKNKPMCEIMAEIERRLEAKRINHERPQKLDDCTYLQLTEEKTALQRALLWLEGARGRPTAKVDRDSARPLYDRYRAVKRLVARYETVKANSNIGELATIMEHETMLFTNLDSPVESPEANDKPSQSDSGTSNTDLSEKRDSEDPTSSSAKSTGSDDTNVVSENVANENLHCLPLNELMKLLIETKNLKVSLKKNIKAFEAEFEVQNSRKVLKDERQTLLPSYMRYKETKARLRLLNALISKQKKANG